MLQSEERIMKGKWELKHRECGEIIYWYDEDPRGRRACFEYIHRVSEEQPVPEVGAMCYCHICKCTMDPSELLAGAQAQ
jgi:hypothetical protein